MRDLLLRQASGTNATVCKAAARALAILGTNLTFTCRKASYPYALLGCGTIVEIAMVSFCSHLHFNQFEMSLLLFCAAHILSVCAHCMAENA